MTTQTPDAVREAIIAAITKADANFGYSYRLTKMDDTGEEHTLFMEGFEPAVFSDREDGYPVIEQRRNAARTDAILAAIASRAGDAGEGRNPNAYVLLEPDAEDVRLCLKGAIPSCPCCEGTPSTFSRFFPHSGIYQGYVNCSRCHVQALANARDRDEARGLAIAAWSKRPATPAPAVDAPSECPECGDTSPLEECATCGAYPTRKDATPAPAVNAVPAGEVEPPLNRHDLYRFMDTLKLSEKREVAKAIRFIPAPLTGETDMQRWSRMLAWAAENGKKTELAIAIRAALSHGEGRK